MLNTARHMNEIVLAVPCDVLGPDERIVAQAAKKANKFGITVPAAHPSGVHGRTHARGKIAGFFGLTLPACFLRCIWNIADMIITSRKFVGAVMFAIMKPEFLFVTGHLGDWGLRSKGESERTNGC